MTDEDEIKEYQVVYEGVMRHVYIVEAESAEEARQNYMESDLFASEMYDGEVTGVNEL